MKLLLKDKQMFMYVHIYTCINTYIQLAFKLIIEGKRRKQTVETWICSSLTRLHLDNFVGMEDLC